MRIAHRRAAIDLPDPLHRLFVLFVVTAFSAGLAAAGTPIGPGVAGQIHALAYDPVDSRCIYAGGDNFGVYRTVDHGLSWHPWNRGMDDPNPKRNSYVDDIVVVPPDPNNPELRFGIYAATHGGIMRRQEDASAWEHETSNLTYNAGNMAGHGGAIPFASLAFDPLTNKLYAGAGSARRIDYQSGPIYPETNGVDPEFSLWCKDLDASAGAPFYDWTEVSDVGGPAYEGNVQRVRQIAIVLNGTTSSRVVIASKEGIFIENPTRSGWDLIWENGNVPGLDWTGWSQHSWGVSAGGDGRLYVLTSRQPDDLTPSVFRIVPTIVGGEYDYSGQWDNLGDDPVALIPPQNGDTWAGIYEGRDLYSINVIPGATISDEQVFVGMGEGRVHEYNGYFRYGIYTDLDGQEKEGWLNFIYADTHDGSSRVFYDYYYVDYTSGPYEKRAFDSGWLRQYWTESTVPLIYHPNDTDRMFVAAYHIPVATGDEYDAAGTWSQRYCDIVSGNPETGYYSSRGLNEMSSRAIGFTESGKLVLGCGDFQAFVASDGNGTSFKDMDPFDTGDSDGIDIETIGEEIYVLRGAPGQWSSGPDSPSHTFGYDARSDPSYLARQEHVIARYDEFMDFLEGGSQDGYHWEFITRAFDDLTDIPSGTALYDVRDFEVVDQNTMFAALNWTESEYFWRSMVVKGTRQPPSGEWTWEEWWISDASGAEAESCEIIELKYVPEVGHLLVLTKWQADVLLALSTETQSYESSETPYYEPKQWINFPTISGNYGDSHRYTMSIKNATTLICDASGEWLYVGSSGQRSDGSDMLQCANVLRVRIPADGSTPGYDEWDLLLNGEDEGGKTNGITYAAVHSDYWPDGPGWSPTADKAAENLPSVRMIAIHPDNPKRIFIGIDNRTPKCSENFHPNNGVWEFEPDGDSGLWIQRFGKPQNEPAKGVSVLGFPPNDQSVLIVGTWGQEFFEITGIAASPAPAVDAVAYYVLNDGDCTLAVRCKGAGVNSDDPFEYVEVDGAAIGLSSVALVDCGEMPDGYRLYAALVSLTDVALGDYTLPVVARDGGGNPYTGSMVVAVEGVLPAQLERVEGIQEIAHSGLPYSAIAFDYSGGSDDTPDLFMTSDDDNVYLYEATGIDGPSQIPVFRDQTAIDAFAAGQRPEGIFGGVSAADIDNDGQMELFLAAGEEHQGHLYKKNAGGQYEDISYQTEWATCLTRSWAGVWGDYDADGWIDLFVVRSGEDGVPADPAESGGFLSQQASYLLRNDFGPGGTNSFIDVTDDVGLSVNGANANSSVCAAWVDVDRDGRLDLFLPLSYFGPAGGSGPGSRLFVQQEDGTFVDEISTRIPFSVEGVSACTFADYKRNSRPDLIVTIWESAARSGYVLLNQGSGLYASSPVVELPGDQFLGGLRVLDYDRDGREDLIVTSLADQFGPRIYLNKLNGSALETVDLSMHRSTADLPSTSLKRVACPVGADWNRDGDFDLFLGRPAQSRAFYYKMTTGGADLPTDRSVAVRLDSQYGINNRPGIGAQVFFAAEGMGMQCQWVSGGSGRGSQDELTLTYAAGSATSATVIVYWPNGHNQAESVAPQLSGDLEPVVIKDKTPPTILDETVRCTREYDPVAQKTIWGFKWRTKYATDATQDQIVFLFDYIEEECRPQHEIVTRAEAAAYTYYWDARTRTYVHSMKYEEADFSQACTVYYRVRSVNPVDGLPGSEIVDESYDTSFRVPYRPQQY